jgi:hypothetical protein
LKRRFITIVRNISNLAENRSTARGKNGREKREKRGKREKRVRMENKRG